MAHPKQTRRHLSCAFSIVHHCFTSKMAAGLHQCIRLLPQQQLSLWYRHTLLPPYFGLHIRCSITVGCSRSLVLNTTVAFYNRTTSLSTCQIIVFIQLCIFEILKKIESFLTTQIFYIKVCDTYFFFRFQSY